MFPIALNHTARILPRHLVNGTVGWISACSAGGNTLLSYITGEMVSKLGIESLQPLWVHSIQPPINSFLDSHAFFSGRLLAMMIIMGTLWVVVPKKSKFRC